MSRMIVGVDPGRHSCGIALVEWVEDERMARVHDWMGWTGREGRWSLARANLVCPVVREWAVLHRLARSYMGDWPTVAEATPPLLRHRAQGGRGLVSLVTQAEAAGALAYDAHARVLPDDWRRAVLRVRGNDASAPRMALGAWGLAPVTRRLPLDWRAVWGTEPPEGAVAEHVCEAACIAVWGARSFSG